MELLAQGGLQSVSIRSVAGEVGLAPNAMYHYFTNREHLHTAVASEVAAMLHGALVKACHRKGPEASIRSLVEAYLAFARDHRLLYEALVVPRPASGDDAVAPELLWRFVIAQVSRVSGEAMSHQAAVSIWALLHGMAALQSAGAFNEEMPFSSLEFALDAWLTAAHEAAAKEAEARNKSISISRQASIQESKAKEDLR
jgi:AcrR family transcriptional regulator